MIGAVQSLQLETSEDRWVQALKSVGVTKVAAYRADRVAATFCPLYRILDQCTADPPYQEALVTPLGFDFNPCGLLFRKLMTKDFKFVPFKSRKLLYYVAEDFELAKGVFTYGLPLVLVEGVLDAEAFARTVKYPFVIAYLTSYVNVHVAALVASLTNNVLLVPDNDESGRNGLKRALKNFNEHSVKVTIMKTIEKDFGDVLTSNNQLDVKMAYHMLQIVR